MEQDYMYLKPSDFQCSTDPYTNPFEKDEDGNYFLKRDIKLQCGFSPELAEELSKVNLYQETYFGPNKIIIRYLIDILIHIYLENIKTTGFFGKTKLKKIFIKNLLNILSGYYTKFIPPELKDDPEKLVETLTTILKQLIGPNKNYPDIYHEFLPAKPSTFILPPLNRISFPVPLPTSRLTTRQPSSLTTSENRSLTTRSPSSLTASGNKSSFTASEGGKKRRRTQRKYTQKKRTQKKHTQKKRTPKKRTQRKKSRKHLKPFNI
jgi:hypothetical protein